MERVDTILAMLATNKDAVVSMIDAIGQAARDGIENVRKVSELEQMIGYADGALTAETVRDRAIQIDELRERHVMGRQRLTHAASTGEAAGAATAEPVIELF